MKISQKYFWHELYWKIRDFLLPQNKWLTKRIPNGWQDKDSLLENIIAATIIEFVDGEKGFEKTIWDDTPNSLAAYRKLNNAYHWFKWQRPALENKEKQLPIEPWWLPIPWDEIMADIDHELALKKQNLDDIHLQNIIKYRLYLWT